MSRFERIWDLLFRPKWARDFSALLKRNNDYNDEFLRRLDIKQQMEDRLNAPPKNEPFPHEVSK